MGEAAVRVDVEQGNVAGLCAGKSFFNAFHELGMGWIEQGGYLVWFAVKTQLRKHIGDALRGIGRADAVVPIDIGVNAGNERAIGRGGLRNADHGGVVFQAVLRENRQYGFSDRARGERASAEICAMEGSLMEKVILRSVVSSGAKI